MPASSKSPQMRPAMIPRGRWLLGATGFVGHTFRGHGLRGSSSMEDRYRYRYSCGISNGAGFLSIARHEADTHHLDPRPLWNVPPWVDDDRPVGEIEPDEVGVLGSDEEDAGRIAGYRQPYVHAGVVHLDIMAAFLQQVLEQHGGT